MTLTHNKSLIRTEYTAQQVEEAMECAESICSCAVHAPLQGWEHAQRLAPALRAARAELDEARREIGYTAESLERVSDGIKTLRERLAGQADIALNAETRVKEGKIR